MSKRFGYARSSTEKQELDAQIRLLLSEGIHRSDIFVEKVSSRVEYRPELENVLSVMEKGDTLYAYKLDRIGRSLKDLIRIVELMNDKGCNIKTLTGNNIVDTTTASGKLMFNLMAIFSEYERDIIRERTLMGLQHAKSKGVLLGRRKALTSDEVIKLQSMKSTGLSVKDICNYFKISKSSYYRYLKGDIDEKK